MKGLLLSSKVVGEKEGGRNSIKQKHFPAFLSLAACTHSALKGLSLCLWKVHREVKDPA